MKRLYIWLLAGGAVLSASADLPLRKDNLTSEVRNDVIRQASRMGTGAIIGPGAGFKTTAAMFSEYGGGIPNAHSTVGAPIISLPSNLSLGDMIKPPENWDGSPPSAYGCTWVDFAGVVIATQHGYASIGWPLNDGTTEWQYPVISPAPNKRPVRLYWTHQRPTSLDNPMFNALQNAGPTVQFGNNYKVHIYDNEEIRLWRDDGDYDGDGVPDYDPSEYWRGYVRLNGAELQALEGSVGSFLLVYSRLDEATGRRVMLDYEVVNVLEPTQTQIDVGIGDQLKPLTRTFDTNALFPMVTRGLTDDADNGEIYVYQHMTGEQKNFLWAIRDSSKDPWKIEVFWRAKEALDVVWPFEVDIYSASWRDENAQVFLRNSADNKDGTVEPEPKVYIPSSLAVEAMDYQVPKKHVHIEGGALYTDFAATNAYSLLKFTNGDVVWFQAMKSVANDPSDAETLTERLGLEILPHDEGTGKQLEEFNFGGFIYPGWIRHDFRSSQLDGRYPVPNAYNPQAYKFPTEWAPTNNIISQIFPVNLGELEVWWSKMCDLNTSVRDGSGNISKLSTPIFFPTKAFRHQIAPRYMTDHTPGVYSSWDNVAPQIVIASGRGSAGLALNDSEPICPESGALKISVSDSELNNPYIDDLKGVFLANVPGNATTNAFTVENWLAFDTLGNDAAWQVYYSNPSDGVPWISFHAVDVTGAVADEPHIALKVDWYGNLWVNGVKKTGFSEIPTPLFHRGYYTSEDYPARVFHAALARTEFGKFRYYINGMLAAEFDADPDEVIHAGDEIRFFPPAEDWTDAGKTFHGDWHLFRLWNIERTYKDIYQNRYTEFEPTDKLLIQYGVQKFYSDGQHTLDSFTLVDSSGNRATGRIGFETGEFWLSEEEKEMGMEPMIANERAGEWIKQAFQSGIIPAAPGRTYPVSATIYSQNNPDEDGYNPNEEHAFMKGGIAYALRCDLNKTGYDGLPSFSSLPYVLVQYADPDRPGYIKMDALRVIPENDIYRFRTFLDAGSMIQSLTPLDAMQPANLHKFISGPLYGDTGECFKDRKGWYWAHQAADDGGTTNYVFEFSYPHQEQFDFVDGTTMEPGEIVGFMADYEGRDEDFMRYFRGAYGIFEMRDTEKDPLGTPIDYTFVVKWPDNVKGLYVNDTLIDAKNGLPAIAGQLSVKVVYEQSMALTNRPSVKLIDPTHNRYGSLKDLPDGIKNYRDTKTGKFKFTGLPPYFRDRLVWNPRAEHDLDNGDTRELELSGKVIRIKETGVTYLWPNVLDIRAKSTLCNPELLPGGDDSNWQMAISSMPNEMYELEDDVTPFDSIALTTTGTGAGYVTLVMNNSANEDMVAKSEVISMHVIKVVPELAATSLHVIKSDNPLDQQLNMKVTSDFGGTPEKWEFKWMYCEPQNGEPSSNPADWFIFANTSEEEFQDWITIGDAGVFGLSDHYVKCYYRAREGTDVYDLVGGGWSESEPCLAEGWIKRVLKAINPFKQRITDYENYAISTELSMIQQAGAPYDGDIPLNLEALNENGLIAIYETVLHHARKLSIDAGKDATSALALALQMAAGRIAELYMVLGNEALADAMNPTVDLGNDSPVDDGAESSIFPFQNQCENLLDEELALLRGRDLSFEYTRSWTEVNEPWSYPYYNRLQWNFTHDIMGGQVAYTLNYGIKDVAGSELEDDPNAPDGSINVYDAVKLYPQGHGDAYGHYLSAVKGYYSILRHPNFGWLPQIESILAGQADIKMSYFHEKRFALAAQAKARTAEMVASRTYRQNYVAGMQDPWMNAEDDGYYKTTVASESGMPLSVTNRAWGVDEWVTRGHLGAYYDWLTVDALLPTRQPEDPTLIKMLDRESTYELASIAASARRLQSTADYADQGLNPLGISDNAIPFDISPSEIDAGKTHFEQMYDRAVKAVRTAHEIFKRVKKNSNALRDQNESADFENMVADEEAAIDRRLKEIYGYPYADDIGPGKLYPQDYNGPDLYHYSYIETYDFDNSGHEFGRYYDVLVNDYRLVTTNCIGVFTSDAKRMEADYGIIGNVVAGAITLYNEYMPKVVGEVNSYLDYYGLGTVSTNSFTLPVAMIDLGQDHMDGKVEYNFTVAAWSNAAFYASYYVGATGFTPKPSSYTGQRRAEGEVQIALQNYAGQLAEIEKAAQEVSAAAEKIKSAIDELTSKDYDTQIGFVTDAAASEVQAYNDAVKKNAKTIEKTLERLKDIKSIIADVATEALPKVAGLSCDLTSLGRSAFIAVKQAAHELLNNQIKQQEEIVAQAESEAEILQQQLNQKFTTYQANEERQKMVNAINELMPEFKAALAKLEVVYNTANATRMKYTKLEAEGEELQNERERIRIQWAADLSQKRYRNMMYQILRDDELQRFNEAFELASKYTFLAAKAYDYETGLLQSDSTAASGSQFLSEIVRSRALGRFVEDGAPLGGGSAGDPGLADILYRMDANWSILKTRLGFNNAQGDVDSFSIRKDLFGRSLGANGENAWRNDLASCWCDDLRTHPVFALHCQPFDPMQETEPGFAIPFSTVIEARKDLFGNDLMGGSTAYSSTYFATKLRGVGVWLETDKASSLPTRPEVYFIPSGLDYMRVPIRSSNSSMAVKRSWQVIDQVLPVPYSLTDSDWDSSDWSALKDVCGNELFTTRKHPAIRAKVGTSFDEGAMVYNARLIGRSVWNDQWYIFIPAASINANNARARAVFLDAVKDIHVNLKTYSLSGN